jgi:hypothetical protein
VLHLDGPSPSATKEGIAKKKVITDQVINHLHKRASERASFEKKDDKMKVHAIKKKVKIF